MTNKLLVEIDRLKDENVNLSTENMVLEKQRNRANYIIDELEKYLNEQERRSWDDYYSAIIDIQDKLKELKEGKK